jgi:class 3 adenylate cyclase
MSEPPGGTVTFLFTDSEGSARLWEQHHDIMQTALALQDAIMRRAIAGNNGHVFKTMGDAFCAAFATAPHALCAAITAQEDLFSAPMGRGRPAQGADGAAYWRCLGSQLRT